MTTLYDTLTQIIGSPATEDQELVIYVTAGCIVLLFVYNMVRLVGYILNGGKR